MTRHGDIDASVRDADPIDARRLAATWSQSAAGREILANIVDASASPPEPSTYRDTAGARAHT